MYERGGGEGVDYEFEVNGDVEGRKRFADRSGAFVAGLEAIRAISPDGPSLEDVRRKLVQSSKFDVQPSMFNVRRSMFNVQHSMFNVQHSTSPCSRFKGVVVHAEGISHSGMVRGH